MCYIPPTKISPKDKGQIDLLDSDYQKQFSRVSSKKKNPPLGTIQQQQVSTGSSSSKNKSFESTATENTLVAGSSSRASSEARKEANSSNIKMLPVTHRDLGQSELKESPMEVVPLTVKNSSELVGATTTPEKTSQSFFHFKSY